MGDIVGVLAAVASSGIGGASVGATRYVAGEIDPIAIGAFRFGIGFAMLLPLAVLKATHWPSRGDWVSISGLGLLFFGLFPILFNSALIYTTAARGALALSTLPLLTMIIAATFGVERLTERKSAGVLIAMIGVGAALFAGLSSAPAGAWRGDLLMVAAACCMALYSIWSRGLIKRYGPLVFTAMAMGVGTAALIFTSFCRDGFVSVTDFGSSQWVALVFLGVFGAAITFYLWALALEYTTPTRVAISVTVNPIAAAAVGALVLGELPGWSLYIGIVAVFTGIWIATTNAQPSQGSNNAQT